jgi:hypothetical protein
MSEERLESFPMSHELARRVSSLLVRTDGSKTLGDVFDLLKNAPGFDLASQENGMTSLSRAGGETSLMLKPGIKLSPMFAETLLHFLIPTALHHLVEPNLNEVQIALLLKGGPK